jgi:ParB family chromosome partitioning protein
MRMPWSKSKADQLALLDAVVEEPVAASALEDDRQVRVDRSAVSTPFASTATRVDGHAIVVPVDLLYEDPNNPRTEFLESDLEELAESIRQYGILQPIVVHPADAACRYQVHFGAKRLRAARLAGLSRVPVTIHEAVADPYAQVAENQKRHGLTPLELAHFIRGRVDAGHSNAMIAKRLGMDATTVAHHLALLELPPKLDEAMRSGRCTSPRTLYELSKLHDEEPERVKALVDGGVEITRAAVAAVRAGQTSGAGEGNARCRRATLLAQANSACARLELTLTRVKQVERDLAQADVASLRQRIADLSSWLA